MHYAGIGSRTTPEDVLAYMTKLASYLETEGYILRSGGAKGADTAFEDGVKDPDHKEIFKPRTALVTEEALKIAKSIHPAWHNCSDYAKACHGRNVYQILGLDLKTLVDFVICWTLNAELIGGTRTAIILAKQRRIPVFNLAEPKQKLALEKMFPSASR